MVSLDKASHAGNSYLLPNAIISRALFDAGVVIAHRCNDACGIFVARDDCDVAENDGNVHSNRTHVNTDIECETNERIRYTSPASMLQAETNDLCSNEITLMRVSPNILFFGGLNDTISGHYKYPVSVNFASFYPSRTRVQQTVYGNGTSGYGQSVETYVRIARRSERGYAIRTGSNVRLRTRYFSQSRDKRTIEHVIAR